MGVTEFQYAGLDRVEGQTTYPDFAKLLGTAAWNRLPAAVRARFSSIHGSDEMVRYTGTMQRVKASLMGCVLAQLARVFDTPVALWTGNQIPTEVRVYPQPTSHGMVWERIYRFRGHAPVTVKSTKCLDRDGQLMEALGGGLRMKLAVREEDGALTFTSTGYYVECLGLKVRLPNWMPPGVTRVIHEDEGNGRFRFTMYTSHSLFGTMFFQTGVFEAPEEGT